MVVVDGVTKGSRVRVVLMDRATMSWGVMVVLVEGATLVVVDWVTKGSEVGVVLVEESRVRAAYAMVNISDSGS